MADPIPEAVRLANAFQAQLRAENAAAIEQMARRWTAVENALRSEIEALADEIAALREAGEEIPRWKLMQMDRYHSLLAQVGQELATYSEWAARQIADEAIRAQEMALEQAARLLSASAGAGASGAGRVRAVWDRLGVSPAQRIAGLAQAGMPLGEILAAAYPAAAQAITDKLVAGAALGWNPRKTAREILRGGGLDHALNHILLVARDQQIRNYREMARQAYGASDVVYGMKRISAKNDRTCPACLALDGRIYAKDEIPEFHPQCRCTLIPLLVGRPIPEWETGLDWLRKQDAGTQRQVLGKGRYELWREGGFELGQLATVRQSGTWGPSNVVTSLAALRKGGGGISRPLPEIGELLAAHRQEQVGPKVLGYSFFKAKEGQRISVAEARAIGEGEEGWEDHEKIFREQYLAQFGLEADDVEWTIGLWGMPEPSFNARLNGRRDDVIALARAWGMDFDQEAMALLLPNAEADGGYLAWDLGRAVDDETLQQLLGGMNAVNAELAERVGQQYGLEDFAVGLTVKESRLLEFWYEDVSQRDVGQLLLQEALQRADLRATPVAHGGYEFRLLFQGKDY